MTLQVAFLSGIYSLYYGACSSAFPCNAVSAGGPPFPASARRAEFGDLPVPFGQRRAVCLGQLRLQNLVLRVELDTGLQAHARGMEDPAVLKVHAEKIKAALAQ